MGRTRIPDWMARSARCSGHVRTVTSGRLGLGGHENHSAERDRRASRIQGPRAKGRCKANQIAGTPAAVVWVAGSGNGGTSPPHAGQDVRYPVRLESPSRRITDKLHACM